MSQTSKLMTTAEVAAAARVTATTVARWARANKLPVAGRTPGGQLRFREADVEALLANDDRGVA